jgi:hypothetical protein
MTRTTVAAKVRNDTPLVALKALAVRIGSEVDQADDPAVLAPLARTLRLVLGSIAQLEAKRAGAPAPPRTTPTATAIDDLIARRRRRTPAGGAA